MDNVGRFKEISGQLAALKERKRRILVRFKGGAEVEQSLNRQEAAA